MLWGLIANNCQVSFPLHNVVGASSKKPPNVHRLIANNGQFSFPLQMLWNLHQRNPFSVHRLITNNCQFSFPLQMLWKKPLNVHRRSQITFSCRSLSRYCGSFIKETPQCPPTITNNCQLSSPEQHQSGHHNCGEQWRTFVVLPAQFASSLDLNI